MGDGNSKTAVVMTGTSRCVVGPYGKLKNSATSDPGIATIERAMATLTCYAGIGSCSRASTRSALRVLCFCSSRATRSISRRCRLTEVPLSA